MSLSQDQLKTLALELAAVMPPLPEMPFRGLSLEEADRLTLLACRSRGVAALISIGGAREDEMPPLAIPDACGALIDMLDEMERIVAGTPVASPLNPLIEASKTGAQT